MQDELVSVVIPCYNGASFIGETIESVLNQQYEQLEIIVIDDGSTDQSKSVINKFQDPRILYFYQENQGVSAARNKGLEKAKGDYIVFFDADDLMSSGFIRSRVNALKGNTTYQFVCGPIHTFPEIVHLKGAVRDIPREVLHYLPDFGTCPSNYLIRTSILKEHNIRFNECLSSTADRFFFLQLDRVAKGLYIEDAPLLYRVSTASMSNKLTINLINDNEEFLNELVIAQLIPANLKKVFYYKIYYILGMGYIRTGASFKGMWYLMKALLNNPVAFLKNISDRIDSRKLGNSPK